MRKLISMTRGMFYILIASLSFGLMGVFVKSIPHIPVFQIVFMRMVFALIFSGITLKAQGVNPWGNNKILLIARGLIGATALILFFITIKEVSLATASTLYHLSPIFAVIIAIFFVKEKVAPIQWLFFLIAFIGIVLIKGFDHEISFIMLLTGICSALAGGFVYNIIRKLKDSEHPDVIVFYFPLASIPVVGTIALFDWMPLNLSDLMYLVLLALAAHGGQVFMTRAYQLEEVSKIVPVSNFGIVYPIIFGYYIFDEALSPMVLFGMALVVGGIVMNSIYKRPIKTKIVEQDDA
ncbi:MAG: DMT family transporter [Flavobacteriales bacterium]|nr:DMT family transporter [Flavobacteriales bacterium]